QLTGNWDRPKLSDRIGHSRYQPGGATIRPDSGRNRHVLINAESHAMRDLSFDVHGIQPEPGPVLGGGRIEQRAACDHRRIADLGVVARHAFRLASVGSNPPHIQFVWRKSAHKINVTTIRGPDVMVAMYPWLFDEDLFWITAIAIDNECRVTGREIVVDNPPAVQGPRRVHCFFEKRTGRSA